MTPRIAVILVNYRRPEETIDCVRSLHHCAPAPDEIIVVDNGSTSLSAAALRAGCPGITLLESAKNLGFAGGNNLGLRQAMQRPVDYLLLLNNDTTIEPDALGRLVTAAERGQGVWGAKIRYHDRPDILWYAGGKANPAAGSIRHAGLGERDDGRFDRPGDVGFVTGCCMLIHRSILERIGFLDETFFAYLEDVDFCLRARHAGFLVRYEPSAVIYHKVSQSTGWDSPAYLYFNLRNRLLLRRKHTRWPRAILFSPWLCWYYLRQFLRLALRWHDAAGFTGAWYGLVDGLRGFTGDDGSGRLAALPQTSRRTSSSTG
jgi:GT2 family glycosyltransferase